MTTEKIKREIKRILRQLGFKNLLGPKLMTRAEVARDIAEFNRLNKDTRFAMKKENEWICRDSKYTENGIIADSSYFIQDIWGARKVMENRPAIHYDVGSSVAGFIAHLLAQKQKIVLIDIRKMSNGFDTPFLNGGGGKSHLWREIYTSRRDKFRKYSR